MGSLDDVSTSPPKPWITTPCIRSAALSREAGCNIFLKLENLQPSGSFKSRGIGHLMVRALEAAPDRAAVHFFCSSGGNAGLACVAAAGALGRPATVAVPLTTPARMVARLRAAGAHAVVRAGENWAAADALLRRDLLAAHRAAGGTAVYVPPFDHPDVWAGASTLVDELARQVAGPLDGVVCSVGGGGLLCGVMEGVGRLAGPPPRVLAVETAGAGSLHASVAAGELVTLPGITSVATSLGATRVARRALEWALEAGPAGGLVSAVVTDREAVAASARFLDDERMLVEAACGATLAAAYTGLLRRALGAGLGDAQWAGKNVVLVVCGGSNIDLGMLEEYKVKFGIP